MKALILITVYLYTAVSTPTDPVDLAFYTSGFRTKSASLQKVISQEGIIGSGALWMQRADALYAGVGQFLGKEFSRDLTNWMAKAQKKTSADETVPNYPAAVLWAVMEYKRTSPDANIDLSAVLRTIDQRKIQSLIVAAGERAISSTTAHTLLATLVALAPHVAMVVLVANPFTMPVGLAVAAAHIAWAASQAASTEGQNQRQLLTGLITSAQALVTERKRAEIELPTGWETSFDGLGLNSVLAWTNIIPGIAAGKLDRTQYLGLWGSVRSGLNDEFIRKLQDVLVQITPKSRFRQIRALSLKLKRDLKSLDMLLE